MPGHEPSNQKTRGCTSNSLCIRLAYALRMAAAVALGARRAEAARKGVDATINSHAGDERPVDVVTPKIVTLGQVMAMFTRNAEPAAV